MFRQCISLITTVVLSQKSIQHLNPTKQMAAMHRDQISNDGCSYPNCWFNRERDKTLTVFKSPDTIDRIL